MTFAFQINMQAILHCILLHLATLLGTVSPSELEKSGHRANAMEDTENIIQNFPVPFAFSAMQTMDAHLLP